MRKLQLKKEFTGQIITRKFVGIGDIKLDTNKLDSRKIIQYHRNGFSDMFEYVIDGTEVKPNDLKSNNDIDVSLTTFNDIKDDIVTTPFDEVVKAKTTQSNIKPKATRKRKTKK